MKKILLTIGAAAIVGASVVSCGSKGGDNKVTAEDKAFGDSIAVALGEFAGAQQNSQFNRMSTQLDSAEAAKYSREDFMRGLKTVMAADTSKLAYYQGLMFGLQLMQPINGMTNQYGYPVDKDMVIKAFQKVFDMPADSVQAKGQEYYMAYSTLFQEAEIRMKAREAAKRAESPEAQETLSKGKAYAEKMTKEGYTRAESGLVYKIENPGTGDKVKATDKVKINYVGKHVDGEVFDQTQPDHPYTSAANSFVPGFTEALQLVGTGGKVTVVIPSDLAYGADGAGSVIAPNETLVFDIEVLDVNPE